jgi:hypothetical protein
MGIAAQEACNGHSDQKGWRQAERTRGIRQGAGRTVACAERK